jgi:L-fuculose-phosphate aldolase
MKQGSRLVLLTWLHQADRQLLQVHPRGDTARPRRGVFSTRSPDRPNPIGLHEVTVTAIQDNVLRVEPLEAIDGTPVLDIKPLI